MVRVRFAPSPTGLLHVGNARTALFNWLFARRHQGRFILRIEDTDIERSQEPFVEQILQDLSWLHLAWDEGPDIGGPLGPYRQSQRLGIYQGYVQQLLKAHQAYHCYCSQEELEAKRRLALAQGRAPRYDNRCRTFSEAERRQAETRGMRPVIRLKIPDEGTVTFTDLVRGEVRFAVSDVGGDFVIAKSDGLPTFHLSVVVDDHLMQISHVIRGEDHLSNTPRHLLLYQALGLSPPQYAHMSLSLSPEGGRLSKREFAVSIAHYRELGYLPEAVVNSLALLGWSPRSGKEIVTVEEMIDEFRLEDLTKAHAIFDEKKFHWLSGEYIRRADPNQLTQLVIPYLERRGLMRGPVGREQSEWLKACLVTVRDHLTCLAQAPDHLEPLLVEEPRMTEEAKAILLEAEVQRLLHVFLDHLERVSEISDGEAYRQFLKGVEAETQLNGKPLLQPLRVALTGRLHGPELVKLVPVLGRERCTKRLRAAIQR